MGTDPAPCVAAENDYREVARRPAMAEPSVAVVVPTYNRVGHLARTLAGLAGQTYPRDRFEVVVADDGSEDDVAAAVEPFTERVPLRVVRQERDGFGLARARNLGAAATVAEVLVFLDSDSIPVPDFIACHAWWHARAGNLVVAGSRRHVDATDFTPEEIADGGDVLAAQAGPMQADHSGGWAPDDWRRVFYRRTKAALLGDAGFRVGVGSNISVRRGRFEAVGCFSPAFRAWGGEDTECMWRLWNSGMFVVPENRALVYHQVQGDDDSGWREAARRRALALVGDLVPHRFYRKEPTPFATVPKVSWLVAVGDGDDTARLWRELSLSTYVDADVVLWGTRSAVDEFRSVGSAAQRVTVITDGEATGFGAAVDAARGELIALRDGRADVERWLLARCVKRMERNPRAAVVLVGYRIGVERYRRPADLLTVDRQAGRHGLPLFAVARRRELLKDPQLLANPHAAWESVVGRSRVELLINDLASLPSGRVEVEAGRMKPADLAAAGSEELARAAVRKVRRIRARDAAPTNQADVDDPSAGIPIDYIGFTGKNNLGDEAVLRAVRELMPWADIGRDKETARALMVGGGTLVNGRNYYLTRVLRRDSPALEKVVFGVGVRSPSFWGVTEPVEEWWSLFDAALQVGVRGPDSAAYLREMGYRGDVEILGDPALSLCPPAGVVKAEGRVVVCPVWTGGVIHGEDDAAVFTAFAETIRRLRAEGREVVMLSAFPEDDRHLLQLMRDAGQPDMPYLAGYADLDATLDLLASADLVIAERLHAAILAAACGTPFVAVEYRPKLLDFAKSVGMQTAVVRADEVGEGRLAAAVAGRLVESGAVAEAFDAAVAGIRRRQEVAADSIRQMLS